MTDIRRDGEVEEESTMHDEDDLTDDETEPLLRPGDRPNLYRTLSRCSESIEPLPRDDKDTETSRIKRNTEIYGILSVLLIGVFISQTDGSLVLATYGHIASEFDELESGSWLVSAFALAQCVAQPLYGKLSDIYGRKGCLQVAYILFAIGTAGTGFGRTMIEVVIFRAVQGIGGAGMLSMVAIIITDLVPVHEVASLRSYVNVLQTTGRTCGGIIGGFLTQKLGWRWAFLVQIPPMLLAIGLVQWRLHIKQKEENVSESNLVKLRRVDFIGALFLSIAIFSVCLMLDMGGRKIPWSSSLMISILVAGSISALAFVVSARWVSEPIFPLQILGHYDVFTNYLVVLLQFTAQISLMMAVPLYFQATEKVSTAAAGGYLIPSFAGNTVGGLLSGYWIKRTGQYKTPTVLAPLMSLMCMSLILVLWNGHTSVVESLLTFPGGFALGMIASSAFVGLAAGVAQKDIAIAGSGMYFVVNLGMLAGVSAGSAVFQSILVSRLESGLSGNDNKTKVSLHVDRKPTIIHRALTDIGYVQNAPPELRTIFVMAYVQAFHGVNVLGMIAAGSSLLIAVLTRSKKLK